MRPSASGETPKAKGNRFGADVVVRTQSAIVLGLSVLTLTAIGGWAFLIFTAILAGLVLHEWLTITGCRRGVGVPGDAGVLAALVVVLFKGFGMLPALLAGLFLLIVLAALSRGGRGRLWAGLGVIYAVLPAIALQSLRDASTLGLWAIVFVFAVVWTTDVAAFFAGRALGGPKLLVAVSPKKTWSGALGGLFGAIIAATIVAKLAGLPSLAPVIVLAALTSIVAQAGDLLESAIKRCFMVKDSGQLIPGHGGAMDRVDGLIAAALFVALIGWARGGIDTVAGGFLNW